MHTTAAVKMSARELFRIGAVIDTMRKLERQVHRLNEVDCNVGLTSRQEKRREKLENEYRDLASQFGLYADRNRDPRGSALRVCDSITEVGQGQGVTL